MLSLGNIGSKLFGSANDRRLKRYGPIVDAINALEPQLASLSDDDLKAKTEEFRQQIAEGRSLDDILPEAFATVREAAKRTLGQRHFDVQLVGGMVLNEGSIAEMKTGEGKTLVATLPVYLNALSGRGVHVVTVNDYLATRDSEWMGRVYRFLGLSVGVIVHGLSPQQRREAYAADVTYGTNNEFGFDYLRDNMEYSLQNMVQRGHAYAIVDEVDSILVDEARTPLIISGPTEDRSELYIAVDKLIPLLTEDDFELDEKQRTASFTEDGTEKMEQLLKQADLLKGDSLYDVENVAVVHHVNNALKAHKLFQRDKDYIVKNGQVIIIDEFTGRMMEGRRYSDGLHQSLEAKEHANIQPENQTLASITFQNYFRLYDKLAGMTGTALTEAEEFMDIYKLDVVEVADQQADDTRRRARCGLPDGGGEVQGDHRAHRRVPRQGPAGAGRHHVDREVGNPGGAAEEIRHQGLRGAERAPPRARGLHRVAGRAAGRHHHRHQHGRPRHRHPARRQSRHAARRGAGGHRGRGRAQAPHRKDHRGRAEAEAAGARRRRPVHHRHGAARKPAHRQPAARPLGPPGRPRAARSSSCRCRTTSCASSAPTAWTAC